MIRDIAIVILRKSIKMHTISISSQVVLSKLCIYTVTCRKISFISNNRPSDLIL